MDIEGGSYATGMTMGGRFLVLFISMAARPRINHLTYVIEQSRCSNCNPAQGETLGLVEGLIEGEGFFFGQIVPLVTIIHEQSRCSNCKGFFFVQVVPLVTIIHEVVNHGVLGCSLSGGIWRYVTAGNQNCRFNEIIPSPASRWTAAAGAVFDLFWGFLAMWLLTSKHVRLYSPNRPAMSYALSIFALFELAHGFGYWFASTPSTPTKGWGDWGDPTYGAMAGLPKGGRVVLIVVLFLAGVIGSIYFVAGGGIVLFAKFTGCNLSADMSNIRSHRCNMFFLAFVPYLFASQDFADEHFVSDRTRCIAQPWARVLIPAQCSACNFMAGGGHPEHVRHGVAEREPRRRLGPALGRVGLHLHSAVPHLRRVAAHPQHRALSGSALPHPGSRRPVPPEYLGGEQSDPLRLGLHGDRGDGRLHRCARPRAPALALQGRLQGWSGLMESPCSELRLYCQNKTNEWEV